MPLKALHQCSYPGCHSLIRNGSRCALHATAYDKQRPSSTKRGYDRKWREKRDAFLQKHPWCCDPYGVHWHGNVQATQVDHVVPKKDGGSDDEENLQGFCDSCYSRKTSTYDGGFGNRRRVGA